MTPKLYVQSFSLSFSAAFAVALTLGVAPTGCVCLGDLDACFDGDEGEDEAGDSTTDGDSTTGDGDSTTGDGDSTTGGECDPVSPLGGDIYTNVKLLPVIETQSGFVQLLLQPTALGENAVVHVELPAPHNPELEGSLVRLIGDPEDPLVLYRSDGLVELGMLADSPGNQFYSAFITLDPAEIEIRLATEDSFALAETAVDQEVRFQGRTPVAISSGVAFATEVFGAGGPTPIGPCPSKPASELSRWEEVLMITDPAVVQDPARTWDSCTSVGNPDGVLTFHHLMAEMAMGANPPMTVEDFTIQWLETWLDDQVVNGDTIPARMQMFDRVIKPWATASGANALLMDDGSVFIEGTLDWEHAPFRLSAVVNRIDLGKPGGYAGNESTAGELRFVFGVQDLGSCEVMDFSVIFEYGVPIVGCEAIRETWAKPWTNLADPTKLARFSPEWLAALEALTEPVVSYGAAPNKGNFNAINQIRTNENALDCQWEFREFTLTMDTTPDTPVDGPLRPHSVAMAIDDSAFSEFSDPVVHDFFGSTVLPSVSLASGACGTNYSVPLAYNGNPFRGGDSFTAPVDHWEVPIDPGNPVELCARHELSLNSCNGCHFDDTATPIFHVDPRLMPAGLSNFLTGGGTGNLLSVLDSQFPSAGSWEFADLERRFNRLYEVACAECGQVEVLDSSFLAGMEEIAGVLPIDPIEPIPDVLVGPITNIEHVAQILEYRAQLGAESSEQVELGEFIDPPQTFVH
ncbi:hypothetical protein ACNOYE_03105 [Nannocystaceae bacterium ST9]